MNYHHEYQAITSDNLHDNLFISHKTYTHMYFVHLSSKTCPTDQGSCPMMRSLFDKSDSSVSLGALSGGFTDIWLPIFNDGILDEVLTLVLA